MRLVDADKLKSLYCKGGIVDRRVFSILDKMPEEEEGKYKRLYEQARWERDMLEDRLDQNQTIPIKWLRYWGAINEYNMMPMCLTASKIIEDWRKENEQHSDNE